MPSHNESSVPKFASFRPKPSATPAVQVEPEPQRHKHIRDHTHRHHRSRSSDWHRDHEKSNYVHTNRNRGVIDDRHNSLNERKVSPIPDFTSSFVIDRKGDLNNLAYGSVHRYSVPPFHRSGAGHVLGTETRFKIDRDHGDGKYIILTDWRSFMSKTREKYVFAKAEKARTRLLRIRPELETSSANNEEFISLTIPRGTKRKRSGSSSSQESTDAEENNVDYRSIHGKAKPGLQPDDEAFSYATESDSSGSENGRSMKLDNSIRQKTAELSRFVDQNSSDIRAWIALIDHQETVLHAGDDQRRITNAEARSTAEIKIHIYEKALENLSCLNDRERLLVGLMHEGAKVWDIKVQSDRWEELSKDNIDSLKLWKCYLNFKQTNFSDLRYEEIREIYKQRIELLNDSIAKKTLDHAMPLYQQLIYVLLRFTSFASESGYSELGLGIWQALLELNIWRPSQIESDKILEQFQEFWESEVLRVGEDGALGWRFYAEHTGNSIVPDTSADKIDEEDESAQDVYLSWGMSEKKRALASRNPARTTDEVTEDDPYRVILYSDIEHFLICLPADCKKLQYLLLEAFLVYCGLPPTSSSDEAVRAWINDSYLSRDLLYSNAGWMKRAYVGSGKETQHVDHGSDIATIVDSPVKHLQLSTSTMFSEVWFRAFQKWMECYSGDCSAVRYSWVRTTIRQITTEAFTESLGEYYIAFEWVNEPATIKKTCKSLLKRHPSCLRLYNAYALVEWSRGNKEIAAGVFSAAIEMASKSQQEDDRDASLLWLSWIWSCLEHADKDSALKLVLCIPSGLPNQDVEASAASILKSKQFLTSTRDHLSSCGNLEQLTRYAELLALQEYLSSKSSDEPQSEAQGNITSALSVFKQTSQNISLRHPTQTTVRENLLQSATRLLFHHARTGPFRPLLLRNQLSDYIQTFPQNSTFLSLYVWNESKLRIDALVRTIFNSVVLVDENDTLSSRLLAIQHEQATGTVHSVRAAFEHAVTSDACANCPGLWRLYTLWSAQGVDTTKAQDQKLKEQKRTKDIWYRAIRACPWVKEIYLLGVTELRLCGILDDREAKEVEKVMAEKELRLHVDLADMVENWDYHHSKVVVERP